MISCSVSSLIGLAIIFPAETDDLGRSFHPALVLPRAARAPATFYRLSDYIPPSYRTHKVRPAHRDIQDILKLFLMRPDRNHRPIAQIDKNAPLQICLEDGSQSYSPNYKFRGVVGPVYLTQEGASTRAKYRTAPHYSKFLE